MAHKGTYGGKTPTKKQKAEAKASHMMPNMPPKKMAMKEMSQKDMRGMMKFNMMKH